MASLNKEKYLNYCFVDVRILPVPHLKSSLCYKYNSSIKLDYKRFEELYRKESYFLTSNIFDKELIVLNEEDKAKFFFLNYYKTLSINNKEYNFYKIEKYK